MAANPADSFAELIEISQDALEEAKRAYQEADKLQTRLVELEKIASEPKTPEVIFEKADVLKTVNLLVKYSFLDSEYQEKLAAELMEEPSTALHLIQRFVEISSLPFSDEGSGIPKSASEKETLGDPDGWATVLQEGA